MATSRHFEFPKLDTKSGIAFLHKAKQATNIFSMRNIMEDQKSVKYMP